MNHPCPILERPTRTADTGFQRDHWKIVRCCETGFTYLANPPQYERLATEFAWEKTYVAEKQRRREAQPAVALASEVAKELKMTLAPKRNRTAALAVRVAKSKNRYLRLLDVGCGAGELMSELFQRFSAANKRVELVGIEISAELARIAETRIEPFGGRVVKKDAIAGCQELSGEQFDVVVMNCFLEHEAKPLTLLKNLRTLVAPNGVVVIKVPNFNCWNRYLRGARWCGFRFPDHVNYFTPATLRRLAVEAGFPTPRQTWLDRFPLNDNMYAVWHNGPPNTSAMTTTTSGSQQTPSSVSEAA